MNHRRGRWASARSALSGDRDREAAERKVDGAIGVGDDGTHAITDCVRSVGTLGHVELRFLELPHEVRCALGSSTRRGFHTIPSFASAAA